MILPKIHRLPLRKEWHRVKERGRIFQSPFFGVVVFRHSERSEESPLETRRGSFGHVKRGSQDDVEATRFGFMVSKKISKKAVERNRVKRLLSEAVRQCLAKIKPGFEVVFLVKKGILDRGFEEILEEVERVFRKVGLLTRG